MIFDKDLYDKSLWLIIKYDKDNRERIIDFVKHIPVDLYNQIYDCIEICKKNNGIIMDKSELSGIFETSRHVLYWYNIDNSNYKFTLSIGYKILYGDMYHDSIELHLNKYDDMYQLKYFDMENIGKLVYDITTTKNFVVGSEKDYSIVNTPFGNILISKLINREEKQSYRISKFDLDIIPSEIFMVDLENKKNIKRLIKGKK